MPTQPTRPTIPGRSVVSRRAIVDIVRAATLGSYGVVGFHGASAFDRIADFIGLPPRGIDVRLGEELTIELDLTVARGLPIAEVARQVDSAVRYAIRRALDRDVAHLTIRVDGLRAGPADAEAAAGRATADGAITTDDLAASGTDVA